MGSGWKRCDPNPILDEGAPRSIGGMNNAMRLCDVLGYKFEVDAPREDYWHGWGDQAADLRPVQCTWTLTVNDENGKPTAIPFDLIEGNAPLIVGLDLKRHADTVNRSSTTFVTFQRPTDTSERRFRTYLSKDSTGNERIRLAIVPITRTHMRSLMMTGRPRDTLTLVKKMHRLTHPTAKEMERILRDAGHPQQGLTGICHKVHDACELCVSSGQPAPTRKISLTHVNEGFNSSVQADFVMVYIAEQKHVVLNVIDAGTNYGEREIVESRNTRTMKSSLEKNWLYRHGAPDRFSADSEFTTAQLRAFLESHGTEVLPRPTRSSAKNGKVERNNGLFKSILARLSKERTEATPHMLVARASFMANLFHGNSVLSAFQLARGYSPAVLGIRSSVVTPELLTAHVETKAIRALQRVSRSNARCLVTPDMIKSGQYAWVYYNTSAANQPARWVKARVVEALPHMVRSDVDNLMQDSLCPWLMSISGSLRVANWRENCKKASWRMCSITKIRRTEAISALAKQIRVSHHKVPYSEAYALEIQGRT